VSRVRRFGIPITLSAGLLRPPHPRAHRVKKKALIGREGPRRGEGAGRVCAVAPQLGALVHEAEVAGPDEEIVGGARMAVVQRSGVGPAPADARVRLQAAPSVVVPAPGSFRGV